MATRAARRKTMASSRIAGAFFGGLAFSIFAPPLPITL